MSGVKIVDCDCDGVMCCGGRGIAVFQVTRDGKKMNVCTRCDLSIDKDKKILKYAKKIHEELVKFDALGAYCLEMYIADKTYPLV